MVVIARNQVTGAGTGAAWCRARCAANGVAGRARDQHPIIHVAQVGRARRIRPDKVTLDDVAGRRPIGDLNPKRPIAGNHVAGRGDGSADGIVGRLIDEDALAGIIERRCASHIRPDKVALQRVTRRSAALDIHPGTITGDEVTLPGARAARRGTIGPADSVAGRGLEMDAIACIAQGDQPRRVRPDEVTPDRVIGRAGIQEVDALGPIAGDDVAGIGTRPAHRGGPAVIQEDALRAVALVQCTVHVCADKVALDRGVRGGHGSNPRARIARDHVTVAGARAAWCRTRRASDERGERALKMDARPTIRCYRHPITQHADVVPVDRVGITTAFQVDAVAPIASDDISLVGIVPTDSVARRNPKNVDSVKSISQGSCTRRVRADKVALNGQVGRVVEKVNATARVARDEIAVASTGAARCRSHPAADDIVGRPIETNPIVIGQRGAAISCGSDIVAEDAHPSRRRNRIDTFEEVPRNHVALAGQWPAHCVVRAA